MMYGSCSVDALFLYSRVVGLQPAVGALYLVASTSQFLFFLAAIHSPVKVSDC